MSIENELKHYGVLGMKWGVRRYQNSDGTLISAGKNRIKESARYAKNSTAHPIKTSRAAIESLSKNDLKTKLRRQIFQTTAELEDVNDRVAKMQAASKEKKAVEKAKAEAFLKEKKAVKNAKARDAIQKDIDSFKPFLKTGITDKSGKMLITAEEIMGMVAALEKVKEKFVD